MSKPTQFPQTPQDVHTKAMLFNLMSVGVKMMVEGKENIGSQVYQTGVVLYTFATSPYENRYLYYRLHGVFHSLYVKWQPIYNKMVAGMDQNEKLTIVEKNLDPLFIEKYLMSIQLAIMPIQQRGALEEEISPLSHLLWCYIFTWFDKERWPVFISEFRGLLEKMTKETLEEQSQAELEKMIQAGVVTPAQA